MPILKFQCHTCGLSLRKRVDRGTEEVDCSCGDKALLEGALVPEMSVGFSAPVKTSMSVQDSGVESFDLEFDRVIGEEARQKWDTIYERRRAKWDLVNKNPGTNGYDIMKLPDGHYETLPTPAKIYREARSENMERLKTQTSKQE
jgi:hypothetical protein